MKVWNTVARLTLALLTTASVPPLITSTYEKASNLEDECSYNPGYSRGIEYGEDGPPPGISLAFYGSNSSHTRNIE